MKRILITLGIMLVAIFVWADQMPDFRLPDMNDKNVSLESLLEKGPVLIDFWADYCKPCKEAMPHLNTLAEKYEDLTVVLISIDKAKDQQRAKNYLKKNNFKFVTLFDVDQTLAKKLNVSIPPHTFFVNTEGEIIYSHKGFDPTLVEIYEEQVQLLLDIKAEEKVEAEVEVIKEIPEEVE